LSTSASHPFCIATVVTDKAIETMLETGGGGNYRDEHPWLIAAETFKAVESQGMQLPILFACVSNDLEMHFSHWATVTDIDVVELHRGQWQSRCSFSELKPFNPIWEAIDSVFVKPSTEQLEREQREGIRVYRTALDEHQIHPYAICETPAFIIEGLTD